ncbi:MAG: YdcF family protein [Gammaproteobacteria bacterium]|nr:YdcF family protein [Gammaproteobacteria bacterium]MBU1483064.1 YdcF family protein [Gammaproteobacteria bacterium]
MARIVLFRQRQVWMPTISGWLLLLFIGIATSILLANNLYAFLAPNQPVGARVLVVEGWLTPGELDQAIAVFNKGKYERIVTTGGPVSGWLGLKQDMSYAELAADYLAHHGIQRDLIAVVPAPRSAQERTFLSAIMFRESAQRLGITFDAIDVFSSGAHARRSRLLFQMALGQKVRVGILAARPDEFDPEAWWKTSEGVEQMFFQSFGFVWVKCCFWPGPLGSRQELWVR